ncbi:unnamed protein product [Pylaiella littoralis]
MLNEKVTYRWMMTPTNRHAGIIPGSGVTSGKKTGSGTVRPRVTRSMSDRRMKGTTIVAGTVLLLLLLSAVLVGMLATNSPEFSLRVKARPETAEGDEGTVDTINDLAGERNLDHGLTDDGEKRPFLAQHSAERMASKGRDYLNGLVAASALEAADQVSNLALFKTHKTASTTLATLLHRYGKRHNLEVAHFPGFGSTIPIATAAEKTRANQTRFDIMHYHIDTTDTPKQEPWAKARELYKDVMRDPENINFITIFREPRDRLLSFYTFYVEFITSVPIQTFFRQERPDTKVLEMLRSLGCKEFGVETEAELEEFIEREIPRFKLILLSDRFDESLVTLRRTFRWHLIDMTYVPNNLTAGRKRGKKQLKKRLPFADLPKYAQDKIDELTVLDRRLYDAGVAAFEKSRGIVAGEMESELVHLRSLQTSMNEYLAHNPKSPALAMYRYHTAEYYEHPPPVLFF